MAVYEVTACILLEADSEEAARKAVQDLHVFTPTPCQGFIDATIGIEVGSSRCLSEAANGN